MGTDSSRRALTVLGALSLILLLAGCTGPRYRFGEVWYDSREAALQAAQQKFTQDASAIAPTQAPIGGRAVYVIPSRELIQSRGIRVRSFGRIPTPEQIDYVVAVSELSMQSYAEALQRRRLFDHIKVLNSGTPESVRMPEYDATIYLLLKGPDHVQWFLRTASSQIPIPIYFDTSLPEGASRLMSWLESIERLSRECVFRPKSAACSGPCRPAVPGNAGHPFRRKPATQRSEE